MRESGDIFEFSSGFSGNSVDGLQACIERPDMANVSSIHDPYRSGGQRRKPRPEDVL